MEKPVHIRSLKEGIILQLLYSEIFKHPLTKQELVEFLANKASDSDPTILKNIDELLNSKLIQKKDEYYFLFDAGNKIERRIEGNRNAEKLMPKAHRIGKLIHKFPFIEGVGISGSLSKGILHEDADFDFFIITKTDRLWIARTLLVLYKKIFLLNSRKFFCVNYFIDSNHLEIEEKNRFTAVEIATLIPASGAAILEFQAKNNWVKNYFPNAMMASTELPSMKKPVWSRLLHFIFKGRFGEFSDKKMMSITYKRWNKKFGSFTSEKFDLAMKSRAYVSKHHPNDFQNKVLQKHKELVEKYRQENEIELKRQHIEL